MAVEQKENGILCEMRNYGVMLNDIMLDRKEVEELTCDGLTKILKDFEQYTLNENNKIININDDNNNYFDNKKFMKLYKKLDEYGNKINKDTIKNEKFVKTKLKTYIKLKDTKHELSNKLRDLSNLKINKKNKLKGNYERKLLDKKNEINNLQEICNKLSIKYNKLKNINELKNEENIDKLIKNRYDNLVHLLNMIYYKYKMNLLLNKNNNASNIFNEIYKLLQLICEYKGKQIKRNEQINISKQQRIKQQNNSEALKTKRDNQIKYIVTKIQNIDHKLDALKKEKNDYENKLKNNVNNSQNDGNVSINSSIGSINDSINFKLILNKTHDNKIKTFKALLIYVQKYVLFCIFDVCYEQ